MHETPTGPDRDAGRYEIRLGGRLHPRWAAWFDGMALTHDGDGSTVLSGPVADQAALHGLLQKLRDTGLPLVSVRQVTPGPPAPPTRTAHPITPNAMTPTPRRPA